GQELTEHDRALAHGLGEVEIVGAGALLLGEHAHADRRHDDDEQLRHVVEERDVDHLVQVEAREHLRVAAHHAVHLQGLVEGGEEGEEEVAGERQVGGEEHVGDRGGEVRAQLPPGDGEDVAHAHVSVAAAARAPSPVSREMASMKTSSSARPRVRFASWSSTTMRPSLMMTTLS